VTNDRFEYILRYGNHPVADDVAKAMFVGTDAPAGSREKIEVMRKRAELGQPIFHENDRCDWGGIGITTQRSSTSEPTAFSVPEACVDPQTRNDPNRT
jgi:hypothetical protein